MVPLSPSPTGSFLRSNKFKSRFTTVCRPSTEHQVRRTEHYFPVLRVIQKNASFFLCNLNMKLRVEVIREIAVLFQIKTSVLARDPPWLYNPWENHPKYGTEGTRGPTKWNLVQQKFKKGKMFNDIQQMGVPF